MTPVQAEIVLTDMMEEKNVILGNATGEITEKKSRFIGSAFEIHSEAQALQIIEATRKKYYDARHNCYAYVLGENRETQRFSDDKEPQGTAGKPILDMIRGRDYYNTLVIVTRYFGGILLGTGGLIRAYSAAAGAALQNAESEGAASPVMRGQQIKITCDYNFSGKLQYLLSQDSVPVSAIRYEARVSFDLVVPEAQITSFTKKITEASNGASVIEMQDPVTFILKDGSPLLYQWQAQDL